MGRRLKNCPHKLQIVKVVSINQIGQKLRKEFIQQCGHCGDTKDRWAHVIKNAQVLRSE